MIQDLSINLVILFITEEKIPIDGRTWEQFRS